VGDWQTPGVSGRQLVVAAIIVDDLRRPRRVLAAERSTPAALRGRWEFPGGKVEPREHPVAALIRETAEELAVDIEVGAELVHPGAACWPISAAYELRCWFAEVVRGVPTPGDSHHAVRWLGSDDLATVDWLDADRPVAALLRSRLGC
jgi:8-oxo-dGTP diphosphatase